MIDWVEKYFAVGQINTVKIILMVLSAALYGLLFFVFMQKGKKPKKKKEGTFSSRTLKKTEEMLTSSGRAKIKYQKMQEYLSKTGANFMLQHTVTPEEYFLANVTLGIVLALFGILNAGWIGLIAGFLIGFYILKFVLMVSNKKDNDKILLDMKSVFDSLVIKTEGGMFLTSAIQECYRCCHNKRLKQALIDMHNEIITKNDINSAISELQSKFKNKYIDTFCVIIKQAMCSGNAVEVFKDMSDQLADMQHQINLKIKNKTEADTELVQLLIYTAIVLLCLFGTFTSITSLMSWL